MKKNVWKENISGGKFPENGRGRGKKVGKSLGEEDNRKCFHFRPKRGLRGR